MTSIHEDYQLGERIAGLIARLPQGRPDSRLLSQVQDLFGEDTILLGPLRDMLSRADFHSLFQSDAHSVTVSGRDALVQDLSHTYNPAVLRRLAAVLNGSLGLPDGAPANSSNPAPSGWSPPAPAPTPVQNPAQAPPAPVAAAATPSAVLITVLSVLCGALLAVLGTLALTRAPSLVAPPLAGAGGTGKSSPASGAAPSLQRRTSIQPHSASGNLWGAEGEYKFGQLPNSNYPHSCAFSVTDARGEQTLANKTTLEYWACRDEGGDPNTGYTVTWGDGKRTTYTFASDGNGTVVGTNGQPSPMRWRNSSHNGESIIVISHQDGAMSWIPGNVD
ncbi:MAG: hypothetical protein VKM92_01950 [Cyanobacteriota bacterium]|nr:hypothetical protein [Cyanobacteriota bacterium]